MARNGNVTEEKEAMAVKLARETMTGDIRDAVIDVVRSILSDTPQPWHKLPEAKQRSAIFAAEQLADAVIQKAARIIASDGRRYVLAAVNKVTISDGIKLDLEVSKFAQERHALTDVKTVLVVMDGIEEYRGERAPAKPMKDEPEMFDPETGEIPEPPAVAAKSKRNGKGNGAHHAT